MFQGRLLQIFNRYAQSGGEEDFVNSLEKILGPQQVQTCFFDSRDWIGPQAPSKWKQAALLWHNPAAVAQLLEHHRRWKPDAWLMGNVYPVGSLGVYRAALQESVPVIHFVHNFRPFSVNGTLWVGGGLCDAGLRRNFWPEIWHRSWRNSLLQTAAIAAVLSAFHHLRLGRSVSAWVTVSEFLRGKFIEAGLPPERVHTLHPFWMARPDIPVASESDYYLFVGRLIEEKGVHVLLEAWARIYEQRGVSGPKLRIAGRGPLASAVEQAALKNPLVKGLGFVREEDKARLIVESRGLLAPSIWWEALGIVTYEAYEFARPMLGARTGGITETVQHGITGLLHEPGNAAELARQVLELDATPDTRRAMGLAGRAWLLQNMDPGRWKESLFQIIESVLPRKVG
jgi:glycosyltransferase involved in cell wall biosynthesis